MATILRRNSANKVTLHTRDVTDVTHDAAGVRLRIDNYEVVLHLRDIDEIKEAETAYLKACRITS